MIFFGIFSWLVFSFVAGYVGKDRKIGFWPCFLLSIFLSPLIGLIIAFASERKIQPNTQQNTMRPTMRKLIMEGDKLFKLKLYDEAIEKYKQVELYTDKAPMTNFKLAEIYSIKRDKDNSYESLIKALQSGFKDFEKIQLDKNLEYLRKQNKFKLLVANKYKVQSAQDQSAESKSKADELEKLAGLFEKGFLTKEEFEQEKKKILN